VGATVPWRRIGDSVIMGLLFLAILQLPASVSSNAHDAGSQAAYEYWTLHGYAYGRDIIQNVGPLGFVSFPTIYTGFLDEIKLLINIVLTGTLILLLWDRSKALPVSLRIAFLVCAALFAVGDVMFYLLFLMVAHYLMSAIRLKTVLVATMLLSLLALAKGSLFFIALFVVMAAVVNSMVFSRRIDLATATVTGFSVWIMTFWMLAGQSPSDFPEFAYGMVSFSSGYNGAMAIFEPRDVQISGFVALLGSALPSLWRALGSARNGAGAAWMSQHVLFAAVECFILFVVWKHGFVRADMHISIFFCYVLASHVWILFRRDSGVPDTSRMDMPVVLSGSLWAALVIASSVGLRAVHPVVPIAGIAPIGGINKIHDNTLAIFNIPGHFQKLKTRLDKNVAKLQLPKTRALVGTQPIGYFGIFPAPMVYNDFKYISSPSTISFASWNERIMKTDASFYREDSRGPAYLLFDLRTIDNRLAAQDNSLAQLEILHRYEYVGWEDANLILRRVQDKKPLSRIPISQFEYEIGNWLEVPHDSRRPVWIKIDVHERRFIAIPAMAYKPAGYVIEVLYKNATKRTHRFIPKMAAVGFLVNPLILSNSDSLVVRSQEHFERYANGSHPILSKVVRLRITCDKNKALCGRRATVTFEEIYGLDVGNSRLNLGFQ